MFLYTRNSLNFYCLPCHCKSKDYLVVVSLTTNRQCAHIAQNGSILNLVSTDAKPNGVKYSKIVNENIFFHNHKYEAIVMLMMTGVIPSVDSDEAPSEGNELTGWSKIMTKANKSRYFKRCMSNFIAGNPTKMKTA